MAKRKAPQASPSRELDKVVIRMPAGMRDLLAKIARENFRATNGEIVMRLSKSLEADGFKLPEPDEEAADPDGIGEILTKTR